MYVSNFFIIFASMITDNKACYKIVALDDHPMVLEGIGHILSAYRVTATTRPAEMLSLLDQGQQYDLFILDLELPDADGFDMLKVIRSHCPQSALLIYTMHSEPWVLARLASLDIQGVVSKALPVGTLRQAVETIRQGGTFFDDDFLQLMQQVSAADKQPPYLPGPAFQLSEREQQVLQYLAQGMTTAEISERLFISENTVGTYRHRLMTKFDAHNVAQLISKARWHADSDV